VIEMRKAQEFLAAGRLAVVGASGDTRQFGNVIYRALRDHGVDVVAVHPRAEAVAGDPAFPDLASVPGTIDGVVVMVGRDASADVVSECARLGIRRVWLHQGLGGPGAVSDEALALCRRHGVEVVPGACPLMFLEPVGVMHRLHRGARRLRGDLVTTS
jgi:predicted CoA-binding protein